MTLLLVALSLFLAFFAFLRARDAENRANEAERKANLLREELLEMRQHLQLPPSLRLGQAAQPQNASQAPVFSAAVSSPAVSSPAVPSSSVPAPDVPVPQPQVPALPVWPEDQPTSPPHQATGLPASPAAAAAPATRSPSLWGPEFSRARISVFGGALVLGGLAFTLRALGLPQWTLLLSVFAFGAVLYGTARLVPWPVSGALRGLGYGVTALGIGSLAQKLPPEWGPGAVLLGLLLLSAALTWDGLRRREPLLGVMAVGGAILSVWLLTDDLGRISILAAAAVFLLVALAVAGGRAYLTDAADNPDVPNAPNEIDPDALERPDAPQAWRAALALLLILAGLLPVGWLVTALRHTLPRGVTELPEAGEWLVRGLLDRQVMHQALFLHEGPTLTLLMWLGFALLALLPGLALLRPVPQGADADQVPDADQVHDAGVRFGAVWATFVPQALLALVLGVALSQRAFPGAAPDTGVLDISVLGMAVLALALLCAVAYWSWRRHRQLAQKSDQEGSEATAPEETDPEETLAGTLSSSLTAGATGVAAALLVALLGARTEPSALAGLALTLLLIGLHGHSRLWVWLGAIGLALTAVWGLDIPGDPLLRAIPALVAVAGALRAAWWQVRPPTRRLPPLNWPQLAWLAAVGSLTLVVALAGESVWARLALTLLLGAAVWLADRLPRLPDAMRPTLYWAGLPGLLALALQLTGQVDRDTTRFALLLGSGLAALVTLLTARQAGRLRSLTEALGLALLSLSLALWPSGGDPLHWPLALALVAGLAALLPLRVSAGRVTILLLLGAVSLLMPLLDTLFSQRKTHPLDWAGAWALLAVSWLTLDTAGRAWLAARLSAQPQQTLLALDTLSSPVQAAWFAVFLGLAVTAGMLLFPEMSEWWMLAGSVAALFIGVRSCVAAAKQDGDQEQFSELRPQAEQMPDASILRPARSNSLASLGQKNGILLANALEARARWSAGLTLIVLAGLKGASLDALGFSNPRAVVGLSILVTGLSLLLVAVLAPRPALAEAEAESKKDAEKSAAG